jgi:hypothetical protein
VVEHEHDRAFEGRVLERGGRHEEPTGLPLVHGATSSRDRTVPVPTAPRPAPRQGSGHLTTCQPSWSLGHVPRRPPGACCAASRHPPLGPRRGVRPARRRHRERRPRRRGRPALRAAPGRGARRQPTGGPRGPAALAQAGLIEVRQGDTTTVRDYRRSAGLDLLPRLLTVDGGPRLDVVRSIFETRLALAPGRRPAVRRTPGRRHRRTAAWLPRGARGGRGGSRRRAAPRRRALGRDRRRERQPRLPAAVQRAAGGLPAGHAVARRGHGRRAHRPRR